MHLGNIPPGSWKQDGLENIDEIAKVVDESLRVAKPHPITSRRAMFALPESVIFSATLMMPDLPLKELEQAIPFELAERLSLNPEEYHVDFERLISKCRPIESSAVSDISPPTAKALRSAPIIAPRPLLNPKDRSKPAQTQTLQQVVFAVAAKKTLIDSIVELCAKAHLELVGIDIKPGAIIRSVVPGNDQKARIVVDMGVGGTGASVAEGHGLRVTSTVPWGTHSLGSAVGEPIPDLKDRLASVFDELVHITKFFENRVCPGLKIEEVIISGTGASLPNIASIFKAETGLPTILAEPFKQVDTHHFPVPVELSHAFADVIGLAMRVTT